VSRAFEEIDHQTTAIGEISLRRRLEPTLQVDVFEVKLGDEFLMSSLFTVGEEALAHLGLAATPGDDLDVVIGGLGLGYTARAALADHRVRSLHVVDALSEVIGWHTAHLVPDAHELTDDPRCRLVHGDFFAMVADGMQFGADQPTGFDAILVDIDHTPSHLLNAGHAGFYRPAGLRRLIGHIRPGGVFALWSDDPPDDDFVAVLRAEFATVDPHIVTFPNFYTGGESASTIYVAATSGTR